MSIPGPARADRGGVLKLAGLGCAALLFLLAFVFALVVFGTKPQAKLLDAHLAALAAGDLETAYQYVEPTAISKDDLRSMADGLPRAWKSGKHSYQAWELKTGSARLGVVLTGTDGKEYDVSYGFQALDGAWKITDIEWEANLLDAHLAALAANDLTTAYEYVAPSNISKDELQALLELNPQVWKAGEHSKPSREKRTDEFVLRTAIQGSDAKSYDVAYVFHRVEGAWKIAGIESKNLGFGAPLAIRAVKVTQEKVDGGTKVRIDFEVEGCAVRRNGNDLSVDVSLKAKVVAPDGKVLIAEKELERIQRPSPTPNPTVTANHRYTIPETAGQGEYQATILVDDVVSGKGVSQVVPFRID
ncbi:MAG: hypothetical protein HYZ53_11940 [Planctomycetes bacterium]|nr:hypothetical protein [Planctomycetota bacterium]